MKPTLYLGVTALAFGLVSAPAQMQAALSFQDLPSGITTAVDALDNTFTVARRGRGADDGPNHIRRSRGADDGPNHIRRSRGADDGPNHDRRGRGADDGPNHDRNDDHGGGGGHGHGGDDS
ncbi:MAG TPA: hypothetical protein ENK34_14150 [Rhodobacteraceae bacterium]|nr:hypothetical protein [Paracoccaceae bacterium]